VDSKSPFSSTFQTNFPFPLLAEFCLSINATGVSHQAQTACWGDAQYCQPRKLQLAQQQIAILVFEIIKCLKKNGFS
jgi:hypothetical protein